MDRSTRFAAAVAAVVLASLLGGCGAAGPSGTDAAGESASTTPSRSEPTPGGTGGEVTPEAIATASARVTAPAVPSALPTSDPAVPEAGPAVPVAMFRSSVEGIGPDLAARMAPSWRPGCPVPLEDLRYVTVSHLDFAGGVQTGEIVVHADVADGVVQVFAELFAAGYPIRLMRLVDDFGADDTASMEADNTSAFNCRAITGGSAWSEHAYGRAIDLNPVENPYVLGSHVAPRDGRAFADRPDLPGVVHADDEVVRAFARAGWAWGGTWTRPVDYQHFSVSGR